MPAKRLTIFLLHALLLFFAGPPVDLDLTNLAILDVFGERAGVELHSGKHDVGHLDVGLPLLDVGGTALVFQLGHLQEALGIVAPVLT